MRVERGAVAYWSKPASHLEQVLVNRADKEDSRSPFSFMNLIEAYVVTSLRRVHGMKMSKIRSAVDWLKEKYPAQKYPLANNKLITDGLELFIEESGEIVSATRKGQVSIRSIISPYLNRIEWADDDLPIAFYPFTSNVKGPALVTIDQAIQFGRPVIRDTRIKTDIIASRFSAGESIAMLAKEYSLQTKAIEEAIRCERLQKSA